MRTAALVLLLNLFPAAAFPAVIHVPQDHLFIQQAIDAARDGDLILVAPGTYMENIDFKGKGVILRSTEGPKTTVIDGGQEGSVVKFVSGESYDSVLDGFTITNGNGTVTWTLEGGGIFCTASPRILNNIVRDNTVVAFTALGGGIACDDGASPVVMDNLIIHNATVGKQAMGGGIYCTWGGYPTIEGNVIGENSADLAGGGIYCDTCSAIITVNVISGNSGPWGAGLHIWGTDTVTLSNNLIVNNKKGAGVYLEECDPILTNNTVAGNQVGLECVWTFPDMLVTNTIIWGNTGAAIWADGCLPTVNHSDIQGGWQGNGNIDADPLFADPGAADFHIRHDSPCRNHGDASAPGLEDVDFEGDPRVAHGFVDLGADEFHTHLYYTGDAVPGGSTALKFVDLPGTSPVGFWIAQKALKKPLPGAYGDWYLLPPMSGPYTLPQIPPEGVLVLSGTIPPSPPGPYTLYLQAIMGKPLKLTNLCEMHVE